MTFSGFALAQNSGSGTVDVELQDADGNVLARWARSVSSTISLSRSLTFEGSSLCMWCESSPTLLLY